MKKRTSAKLKGLRKAFEDAAGQHHDAWIKVRDALRRVEKLKKEAWAIHDVMAKAKKELDKAECPDCLMDNFGCCTAHSSVRIDHQPVMEMLNKKKNYENSILEELDKE